MEILRSSMGILRSSSSKIFLVSVSAQRSCSCSRSSQIPQLSQLADPPRSSQMSWFSQFSWNSKFSVEGKIEKIPITYDKPVLLEEARMTEMELGSSYTKIAQVMKRIWALRGSANRALQRRPF